MKLIVFGIFDVKAKCYSPPFFMSHNGQAIRFLQDLCSNVEAPIAKHPEDYILYSLAEFDNETGKFISKSNPEHLAKAIDFVVDVPRSSAGGVPPGDVADLSHVVPADVRELRRALD